MSKFETLKQELARYAFPAGISTSVLLEVSPPLRRVLQKIMRQGSMTFVELSDELNLEGNEATEIAELFVKCGFLKSSEKAPSGDVVFRICHTRSHRPDAPIAIWREMLDDMRDDVDTTDTPKVNASKVNASKDVTNSQTNTQTNTQASLQDAKRKDSDGSP